MSKPRTKSQATPRRKKNAPSTVAERLASALRDFAAALDATTRPSMIIGGIAAIARGVPRLTRDIDGTIAGEGTDLTKLLATCSQHGIVPRIDDAISFAMANHVLLLRHSPTGTDIDLSLAWLSFELDAIRASETVSVHGIRLRLPQPEDLVIYKLVAWRPQDQQDIERLVALHGHHMNIDRIRQFTREVASMLDAPERVEQMESLLSRALP